MPSLQKQFGKNILSGWIALAVRMIIVFLINPFIIHSLGNQLYGVWTLIFSIINYLTILDLGLQQALVRYVSKFLSNREYDHINSILNTAFLIYSAIAAVVILLTLGASFFIFDWFHIPAEFIAPARAVLLIIGLNTAVNFALLPWGGSLGAFHRYDIANTLAIGEDILRAAAIVILLYLGYGIVPLAIVYLAATILRQTIAAILLRRLHSPIKFNLRLPDRPALRLLWGYGLTAFFVSAAWLMIANTDYLIIGAFLDSAAITIYAIPVALIVALRSLIHAITFPLRPLVSDWETRGEIEKIRAVYLKGTALLYFFTFAVAGGTIFFADHFIRLWMGPGYEQSATVLKILIIPAALYLPQLVGEAILFGISKHRLLLGAILIEGIINLGLSLILVGRYGLTGVAIGTVAAQIVTYLILFPGIMQKTLGFRYPAFLWSLVRSALLAFIISAGFAYLWQDLLRPSSWPIFILEIVSVVTLVGALGYLILFRDEIRPWRELSS